MLPHPVFQVCLFRSRITKRNLTVQMRSPAFFPSWGWESRPILFHHHHPLGLNYTHLLLIVVKSLRMSFEESLSRDRSVRRERFQQLLQMGKEERREIFFVPLISSLFCLSSLISSSQTDLSSFPFFQSRAGGKRRKKFVSEEERNTQRSNASQTTHVWCLHFATFSPRNKRTNRILQKLQLSVCSVKSLMRVFELLWLVGTWLQLLMHMLSPMLKKLDDKSRYRVLLLSTDWTRVCPTLQWTRNLPIHFVLHPFLGKTW